MSSFEAVSIAEETGSREDFVAAYNRLQKVHNNERNPHSLEALRLLEQRLAQTAIATDVHTALIVGMSEDVLRSPFWPTRQVQSSMKVMRKSRYVLGFQRPDGLLHGEIATLALRRTREGELVDSFQDPAQLLFSRFEDGRITYQRKVPLDTAVHEQYSDYLRRVSVSVNTLDVYLLDSATRIRLADIALSILEGGNLNDAIDNMPPPQQPIEVIELPPYNPPLTLMGR